MYIQHSFRKKHGFSTHLPKVLCLWHLSEAPTSNKKTNTNKTIWPNSDAQKKPFLYFALRKYFYKIALRLNLHYFFIIIIKSVVLSCKIHLAKKKMKIFVKQAHNFFSFSFFVRFYFLCVYLNIFFLTLNTWTYFVGLGLAYVVMREIAGNVFHSFCQYRVQQQSRNIINSREKAHRQQRAPNKINTSPLMVQMATQRNEVKKKRSWIVWYACKHKIRWLFTFWYQTGAFFSPHIVNCSSLTNHISELDTISCSSFVVCACVYTCCSVKKVALER